MSRMLTRHAQAAVDMVLCGTSLLIAFELRFDGAIPTSHKSTIMVWVAILPLLRLFTLLLSSGYQRVWKYFNMKDACLISLAALPPTALALVFRFTQLSHPRVPAIPSSVAVIECTMFCILSLGVRVLRRGMFQASSRASAEVKRVILVGTGSTLFAALHDVGLSPDLHIVGLLAPDTDLQGFSIGGYNVIGDPQSLDKFLVPLRVDIVLIAATDLPCVGDCVRTAADFGAEVRLLPSAENVLDGTVRVSAIPHPELALWERQKDIPSPHSAVMQTFREKVVLITGAGGSIGSELCRQVAALPISSLILLDQDENAIFEINSRLASSAGSRKEIVPRVADIRDRRRLEQIFQKHQPDIVLHAAAYKHVGMMEENSSEAVLNNVGGTRAVLEAACGGRTERFLMISTDKAVNPTSVMGATKRVAELLVQNYAALHEHSVVRGVPSGLMRCACVRFGNVLGSRGSVVPIFLRQIASGGPVTITHESMTRYFMTIPEAVRLVLQACTLGARGDIFMLDMGESIKIVTLARRLIEMSGLVPDKDIEIRFTGPRRGEKFHEQLWYDDSAVGQSLFPGLLTVKAGLAPSDLSENLRSLENAALVHDEERVLELLYTMPIDFKKVDIVGYRTAISPSAA
jgi:FlaA1/EpsC-like NDP-sugar epimerase